MGNNKMYNQEDLKAAILNNDIGMVKQLISEGGCSFKYMTESDCRKWICVYINDKGISLEMAGFVSLESAKIGAAVANQCASHAYDYCLYKRGSPYRPPPVISIDEDKGYPIDDDVA